MSEWWTYGVSDFLMFSARTYYRMLERYNQSVWPGQILTLGLGVVMLGLLRRTGAWQGRIICAILALLWIWVAGAFLWLRYVTINWAAIYIVPMFLIEALLLIWIGCVRGRLSFRFAGDAPGRIGITIFIVALALYPAIAPLLGRTWRQAEVFGIAPDPTAIATLGLLLLAPGRVRWELMAVPLLWCLITGLTLWAMDSPDAWIPPAAAMLVVVATALGARGKRATAGLLRGYAPRNDSTTET
jgi:hypothetical protein